MACEELFLRIDTLNQLNLAKGRVNEHNIEEVMSLYSCLCSFNQVQAEEYYIKGGYDLMDKSEFRYIEEKDTVEGKERLGFIASVVEFIKEEVRELWSLVESKEK